MSVYNKFEFIVGLIILLLVVFFIYYAHKQYQATDNIDSYNIFYAKFDDTADVKAGDLVYLKGIAIGRIKEKKLVYNNSDYDAIVTLNINKEIKIPVDSKFIITNNGLIGKQFISVDYGYSDKFLKDKDNIYNTTSPIKVHDLINKIIFNKNDDKLN